MAFTSSLSFVVRALNQSFNLSFEKVTALKSVFRVERKLCSKGHNKRLTIQNQTLFSAINSWQTFFVKWQQVNNILKENQTKHIPAKKKS